MKSRSYENETSESRMANREIPFCRIIKFEGERVTLVDEISVYGETWIALQPPADSFIEPMNALAGLLVLYFCIARALH